MKLQNYIYQCKSCNNVFKAPELIGESYGEFLLRDANASTAYIHALSSPTFSEVSILVKNNNNVAEFDDIDKSTILHKVFSIACDFSKDNLPYNLEGFPPCERCKSTIMASWEQVVPAEIVTVDVPTVTHTAWDKLTDSEKKAAVDRAIADFLKNAKELGFY